MVRTGLAQDPEVLLFAQRVRVGQIVGVLIRYGVADPSDDADEHRWLVRPVSHTQPDPTLVAVSRANGCALLLMSWGPCSSRSVGS